MAATDSEEMSVSRLTMPKAEDRARDAACDRLAAASPSDLRSWALPRKRDVHDARSAQAASGRRPIVDGS